MIRRLVRWAEGEDNIRAVLVIGSRARRQRPADEWSDLDLLIFARDPEPYWAATGWLRHLGTPWLTFVEPAPLDNGFERRVLFQGGLDVDFVPDHVAHLEAMLDRGPSPDMADMIRRGVRFVVDKQGFAARLNDLEIDPPAYAPPDEAAFLNLVNDFWYHTVWAAKHLRRGELWWGKSCCDGYLKDRLLRMLEWHARASHPQTDTWMRGRFLEEWADPRAVASLPAIFAHYDASDT